MKDVMGNEVQWSEGEACACPKCGQAVIVHVEMDTQQRPVVTYLALVLASSGEKCCWVCGGKVE